MEEITRQQVPRWDNNVARKQLAAIAFLRKGSCLKSIIGCLAASVIILPVLGFFAFPSDLSVLLPLSLTIIALGLWAEMLSTLGPAFGGYDNGQWGACPILVLISAVVMLVVWMNRKVCYMLQGHGFFEHCN